MTDSEQFIFFNKVHFENPS